MKLSKLFFLAVFGFFFMTLNAQNVQSNALATSGGLLAGTTTSGSGGNTFYGYGAGIINSTGDNNTFFGHLSGDTNSTGRNNCFFGYGVAEINSNGNNDTYIGTSSAGEMVGIGNNNSFLGYYSGFLSSGSNNTFLGTETGNTAIGNGNVYIGYQAGSSLTNNDRLIIGNSTTSQLISGSFSLNQLKFNAKVGVGFGFGNYPATAGSINLANYNLFVKGGILTEEVRISLQSAWADYVFAKNYNLPKLNEVEAFIAKNGHLQNVPSAKEIKENGIELGEMAKIQQEKIEELTLYIIEQNKINEKQNAIIEKLEARLQKLEKK